MTVSDTPSNKHWSTARGISQSSRGSKSSATARGPASSDSLHQPSLWSLCFQKRWPPTPCRITELVGGIEGSEWCEGRTVFCPRALGATSLILGGFPSGARISVWGWAARISLGCQSWHAENFHPTRYSWHRHSAFLPLTGTTLECVLQSACVVSQLLHLPIDTFVWPYFLSLPISSFFSQFSPNKSL